MGLVLKILVAGLLMLSVSACFRKKPGIGNLKDWLEMHYPGRFEVLSTGPDDAIRNLSFKVKKSLVAEKSDPLVQVQLKWDKRETGFGLTTAKVDSAFAQAKTFSKDAYELLSLLKKQGFDNMAAGIQNWTAMVLLFETSTPESRQERLRQLENAFSAWPKSGSYGKEVLLMEPAVKTELPGEILPLSYFLDGNGQFRKQATYSFYLPQNQELETENAAEIWQYNTLNDQFSPVFEQARSAMEAWAKKNVRQPYFLMETSEYEEISQQPLQYRFKFPFTDENQAEAASNGIYVEQDGYFSVVFDLEKNEAVKIEIIRE